MKKDKRVGHYYLSINDSDGIPVRAIGYIDETECNTILNMPEAPKKVSTAEGIDVEKIMEVNKRFVLVIKSINSLINNKEAPSIYISPIVDAISFRHQRKLFICKENGIKKEFIFEESK